jgi:hypothetical protein
MSRAIALEGEQVPTDSETQFVCDSFLINANGLAPIRGNLPFEEWDRIGNKLAILERGIQFAVGDWLNNIEDIFGEQAAQSVDATRWSERTIAVYRWVAKNIPPKNRMMDRGLTFKHHQILATFGVRDQKKWLTAAYNEGEPWTVARLKLALREGEDLPVVAWNLIVQCPSAERRVELQAQLEGQGLACRPVDRRARPAKESEV